MAVLKLHWLDDFAMPLVYLLISFSQVCARCHIRPAPSFSWLAGKLFSFLHAVPFLWLELYVLHISWQHQVTS